ncbi:MAG: L-threonylcarbamoyladenylate synthase [Candidatus Eisenbacteria bacterium]|nr:L-threonylcarbamoyladenylate synthase [Candidatus Eisenbacteria bacterium]
MSTGPIQVDLAEPDPVVVEEAGRILRLGGLIAHPSDTIFGLAADPSHPGAIERLRRLKGRTADRPFILLIDGPARVEDLSEETPNYAIAWISTIWPAPLTLVLKARPGTPGRAEDGSVALRWPAQPLTLALVGQVGGLLASTSANRAGEPPVADGAAAWRVFGTGPGGVDLILADSSATNVGPIPRLESTIIDCRVDHPRVIRVGAIGLDRLGLA